MKIRPPSKRARARDAAAAQPVAAPGTAGGADAARWVQRALRMREQRATAHDAQIGLLQGRADAAKERSERSASLVAELRRQLGASQAELSLERARREQVARRQRRGGGGRRRRAPSSRPSSPRPRPSSSTVRLSTLGTRSAKRAIDVRRGCAQSGGARPSMLWMHMPFAARYDPSVLPL